MHADLVVLGSPENELSAEDFILSTVLQVISRVACPMLCVPSSGSPASVELIWKICVRMTTKTMELPKEWYAMIGKWQRFDTAHLDRSGPLSGGCVATIHAAPKSI